MTVPTFRDKVVPESVQIDVGDRGLKRRALGPDAAAQLVAESYLPFRILPQRPGGDFVVEIAEMRVGRMTARVIWINAAARLVAVEAEQVHVALTLRGQSVWQGNAEEGVVARSGQGVVFSPGQAADTLWSDRSAHLCLMVPQETLETELEVLTGRSVRPPLRFEPSLRLGDGPSRLLAPALKLLVTELPGAESALRFPGVGRHVEGLVLDGLLLEHQHNHSQLLERTGRVAKTPIARAVELMEASPEPWSTVALAQEVHLSVRALQEGFRREHELTPMAYQREVRLRRARRSLVAALPGSVRVQDVALQFGFLHLGRFAAVYREQFGENPSTTLARPPQ